MKTVLITGVVFFIVSIIAADKIAQLFAGNRNEIITIVNSCIKIFAFSFLVNGYNFIASAYFTSIGNAKRSAFISILRSMVLISVFVFILPIIFGDTGIWLSVPLSEIITFGFSYILINKSKSNLSFPSL